MVQGPFYADGPIPAALADKFFFGMEEEKRAIARFLSERQAGVMAVLGPGGAGKTSLVMAVASKILVPRTTLDCRRVWPATTEKFRELLMEATRSSASEALAPDSGLESVAVPRKARPEILVVDNLDAIDDLDPRLLDDTIAFLTRLPQHVVVTAEGRDLRRRTPRNVQVQPFSEGTSAEFLARRFETSAMTLEDGATATFYEFSRGNPGALQRLGDLVWQRLRLESRQQVTVRDVEEAVADDLTRLPSRVLAPWLTIRGKMRDIFVAMCLYELASPTEIAHRIGLEPKSAVVLLGRLEGSLGLVKRTARGRYEVQDPLLKHYVRKEWATPLQRSS